MYANTTNSIPSHAWIGYIKTIIISLVFFLFAVSIKIGSSSIARNIGFSYVYHQ